MRGGTFGALALVATACGEPDDGGATPVTQPGTPDLVFTDANNYAFTVELTLATTELKAGSNVLVDWSGTSTDFRGRPFEPTEVDKVTIAAIDLDNDALIGAINGNSLQMGSIATYYEVVPESASSASFSDFQILGNNTFQYESQFVPGFAPSWLVSLWKDNERGVAEILASQFLEPVEGADDVLAWNDGSATLDFDPDLGAAPIVTVAGAETWSLDWSAVLNDVNGSPFDPEKGDTLRIAHLPVADAAAAEAALLQLDLVASEMYFLDVYGMRTVPDLSAATTVEGTPFPGFTTDGVWLVSIECTALVCFSPAPMLLAVVQVQ